MELNELENWSKNAMTRLNLIISQLKDMDQSLNDELKSDDLSIMELLELFSSVQKESKNIMEITESTKTPFSDMKKDLKVQMELLENMFTLMQMKLNTEND